MVYYGFKGGGNLNIILAGFTSLCMIPLECMYYIASTIWLKTDLAKCSGNGALYFAIKSSRFPP